MLRHYLTLKKLCCEFESIIDAKIIECFSQEKNVIIIYLYKEEKFYYLQISTDSKLGSVFLRSNFARAGKNSIDLFQNCLGQTVQKIEIAELDRIIKIELNSLNIYVVLYGASKSNIYITDKKDMIVSAFKNESKHKNKKFDLMNGDILRSAQNEGKVNRAQNDGEKTLFNSLNSNKYLGKYYAEEVIIRFLNQYYIEKHNFSSDDEKIITEVMNSKLNDFSAEELNVIEQITKDVIDECLNSQKTYLLNSDRNEGVLSLIPLHSFNEIIKEYSSISYAVQDKVIKNIVGDNFNRKFNIISVMLEKKLNHLKRKLSEFNKIEISEKNIEKYRKFAEILISLPNVKQKPNSKVLKTNDWEGNEIEIEIDEKLNILENSQKYYAKIKALEEKLRIRRLLLPKIQKQFETLEDFTNELQTIKNLKELHKFKEKLNKNTVVKMEKDQNAMQTQFREFDLGDGFMLYVGRNAENNDKLTMHFAKPNDLWFHARGSAGSHAVLKMNKNLKPPKPILKRAAEIAAYYSQARNAKYVPVAYTFKKYVTKPRGANPGSVCLNREDVIMVEPKLPKDTIEEL